MQQPLLLYAYRECQRKDATQSVRYERYEWRNIYRNIAKTTEVISAEQPVGISCVTRPKSKQGEP